MLSPGLEVLKNSSRIKHNSQFLGCDHVLSQHIFIMCQILQGPGQAAHPWTSTPGPWTCTLCPLRSQGRLHTPRQAHQVRGHARSVHRGARAGCTPPDKHATSTDEQTCDKGSSLTSVCGASTRTSQGIITVLSNPRARSLFISLCV